MNISRLSVLLLCSASLASLLPLNAASWVISPGQSLQAAIDAAADGDNITIQSGGYDESITITKGLDIRGVGVVSVTGTLTITDTTLPVYLADLNFGKTGATGITITGADQDIRMDRCTLALKGDFSMTGGEFYGYKNDFTDDVAFDSSDWTFQRSTVAGDVTVTGDSTSKFIGSGALNFSHIGGECTIFQSDVTITTVVDVRPESAKSWIAYSTLCYTEVFGSSEIVGNHILLNQAQQLQWPGGGFNNRETSLDTTMMEITNSGGAITIRNNLFKYLPTIKYDYSFRNSTIVDADVDFYERMGLHVMNGSGLTQIFNNTFVDYADYAITVDTSPGICEIRNNHIDPVEENRFDSNYYDGGNSKRGLFEGDSNFEASLRQIFDFDVYFIYATSLSVIGNYAISCGNTQSVVTNNLATVGVITGGVQSNNFSGSVAYENTSLTQAQPYQTSDVAVVDKGSAELIYNDLDGSLNDIGAYGGHSYDPSGRTTTNPVILSGSVAPLYVKRGGSVTVDARAAVVAAP